jgi:hypothetical protein
LRQLPAHPKFDRYDARENDVAHGNHDAKQAID